MVNLYIDITGVLVDKTVMCLKKGDDILVFCFDVAALPKIENSYIVVRNNTWKAADPYNILMFSLDGSCNIQTNGETLRLSKGESVFIPANQSYTRTSVGDEMCKLLYVHFSTAHKVEEKSFSQAAQQMAEKKKKLEESLLNSNNLFVSEMTDIYLVSHSDCKKEKILEVGEKIEKLLTKYKADNYLYIAVYLCELLATISRSVCEKLGSYDADTQIVEVTHHLKKAVWYIKQNYSKKITVEDLCACCNMSQSQLTRYFKSEFSTTPNRYITEFKINRAKEMFLNAPELSIKTVSSDLGFDDQHYFSRIFTKLSGETPTEYRTRVNNFPRK